MNRYLINLSYIGTRFRGIQRKIDKSAGQFKDPHTVQGVIEEALLKLRPVNEPLLKLSSRCGAWLVLGWLQRKGELPSGTFIAC
uniref:tRNA pseudouridine synthase n=1 Tax=Anopheles gambiae TaxID=7165 RepID=A0A903XJY0_ANOGA